MMTLQIAVVAAGIGQLCLAAASLAIPRVLNWAEQLRAVRPLTRQVFWTYAGYIWTTNVSFGLVSVLMPGELLNGSPLAAAVCGFITLYWLARVVIQFTYYDRSDAPPGRHVLLAEVMLVALFVLLVVVYGAAVVVNLKAVVS